MPASRETAAEFRRVIETRLLGCYQMAQECGRIMRPGPAIINISSVLAVTTAGLPQAQRHPVRVPPPAPVTSVAFPISGLQLDWLAGDPGRVLPGAPGLAVPCGATVLERKIHQRRSPEPGVPGTGCRVALSALTARRPALRAARRT